MVTNVSGPHSQPMASSSEQETPLEDYTKFYQPWAEGHEPSHSTSPTDGHPTPAQPVQAGGTAEERLRTDGISMVGRGYQNIVHNPVTPDEHLKTRYKEVGMLESALVPDAISMQVPYMSPEQRERYRLSSSDGVLRDHSGQPFDTGGGSHLIVMDKKGRMYAGPSQEVVRHSSFLAGNPVAAAGLIQATNGRVTTLRNDSGHYQVPQDYFNQLGKELKRRKVDVAPNAAQNDSVRLTSKQINKRLKKQFGSRPDVIEHSSSVTDTQVPIGRHKPGQLQRLHPTGRRWGWF